MDMTVICMTGTEFGKISVTAKDRLGRARHEHSRKLKEVRKRKIYGAEG